MGVEIVDDVVQISAPNVSLMLHVFLQKKEDNYDNDT